MSSLIQNQTEKIAKNTEQLTLLNTNFSKLFANPEHNNSENPNDTLNSKNSGNPQNDPYYLDPSVRGILSAIFGAMGSGVAAFYEQDPKQGALGGVALFNLLDLFFRNLSRSNLSNTKQIGGGDPTLMGLYLQRGESAENNTVLKNNGIQTSKNYSSSAIDDMGMSFGMNTIKKHMDDMINFFNSKVNSSQNKTQPKQQKVRRVKIRKPPKPKTTANEDFGDETLNKVYNTTKFALETVKQFMRGNKRENEICFSLAA